MSLLRITAPTGAVHARIQLPYSKSFLNRSLLLKALAGDALENVFSTLNPALLADDCHILQQALLSAEPVIDVKDAGTAMRFSLAYFACGQRPAELTGTARMQQRPIGPLVDALRSLGADIVYAAQEGCPPVRIRSAVKRGGSLAIDASVSSQFVSALLMIGPLLQGGLELELNGTEVSAAYTDMTIALMQMFGAGVVRHGNKIKVEEGRYKQGMALVAEPDWSAASYWFLMAALLPAGSSVLLAHLSLNTLQGDKAVAHLCRPFGVHAAESADGLLLSCGKKKPAAFSYDFTACPDLVPAMAALCAATGVQGTFSGVGHLHLKESDRVQALASELVKTGTQVSTGSPGTFIVQPSTFNNSSIEFDVHLDHRIAMSLAALSLVLPEAGIQGAEVVSKSYPGFWQHLQQAGFRIL